MDRFLEFIGALGVIGVLLIIAVVIASSAGGSVSALTIMALLPWALPAIVGFVIIAAFGNMLKQLKAIRAATERQTALFRTIVDKRPAKAE